MRVHVPNILVAVTMMLLIIGVPPLVQGQTSVALLPVSDTVRLGGTETMSVSVAGVANLHAAHTVVTFDSATIEGVAVTSGSLLGSGGASVFFSAQPVPGPGVSAFTVDQAILGPGTVSGSGVLFNITFRGRRTGSSPVTIATSQLRDVGNTTIPASVASGTLTVIPRLTSIQLVSTPNPSAFGEQVLLTAHVSPAEAPGTVIFYDGTAMLGTGSLNGGTANLELATLGEGVHTSMTAVYEGTASYAGSGSADHLHTVVPATVTDQYSMRSSWNLIALPLAVADPRASAVFPTATSFPYVFGTQSGYVRCDTLIVGVGYWLKFPSAQVVSMTGALRTRDTVAVSEGWNLIGPISIPTVADSIIEIPPGIVLTPYYGYAGTYSSADTLQPANGYWVKVRQNGIIVLR
jgi:hypothetical protein